MSSAPFQQLWLVIHARVAILDVEWINIHHRLCLFKTKAKHQAFRPTISGTKGEISNAVENWAAAVDFEFLNNVWVVTHNGISATLYRKVRFRSRSGRRFELVGATPMEGDDDPIYPIPKLANIRFEFLENSHCSAGQSCRRRAPAVPVVAQ